MRQEGWMVYGAPGWGSVLAEAALVRCGVGYQFVDVEGFDTPGPQRDQLLAINPMAQAPTVVLPDGTVMTESVAIALLLSELYPDAGLAPPPGSPTRALFLRRMVWFGAAVYSTFTYADYPQRWAPSEPEVMRERVREHRRGLWRSYEQALAAGAEPADPALATGLFVSIMSRWGPGRPWFEAECPHLFALATAVDGELALQPLWLSNFPAT